MCVVAGPGDGGGVVRLVAGLDLAPPTQQKRDHSCYQRAVGRVERGGGRMGHKTD